MPEAQPSAVSIRRYDLDWLRVFATLLLVPYHSALIFALNSRAVVYVRDRVQSDELVRFASFVHLWHMPLFFAIAGASTWFALGYRSGGQYMRERMLRLLVPLVFGVVILVPPMTYVHRALHAEGITLWQHYLGFFRPDLADVAGYSGSFTPAHLWFILFLLAFSMMLLPLFLWLRSAGGKKVTLALAACLGWPGMLLLLAVPLTLASAVPILGDKNPVYYGLTFLLGFVLMTDERFQKAIDRDLWIWWSLSLVGTPMWFWNLQSEHPQWSAGWIGVGILYNGLRWTWMLAILALAHRYFNRTSRVLRYASEAAYPFYILHMPIDTYVGLLVIQWQAGIGLKYAAINVLTIALTWAVYELIVRRLAVLRFLFGMKATTDRPAIADRYPLFTSH